MAGDRCDLLCLDLPKAEALRAEALTPAAAASAAARSKALADPTRVALAAVLGRTDELCVCDLAWISGRAENLVSHHLRVLRESGLAVSRREGKMVLYSLSPVGHALLAAVIAEDVPA
ncbi:Cadmium resistance transcriptional regulatory protein CadC [Baekduia alba]|uniref:ArsR/SmtB family transcription factor n=1 Tax=Baekduia alba TaxID=2997333 RepID=UPI00233FC741|nr:metalloregulator ArsR/SmtB family transcription factor [Baekduia alba]WCB93598.1 Cadmium resistance transcriptional regulatory protein CadC [Baekduia alba]